MKTATSRKRARGEPCKRCRTNQTIRPDRVCSKCVKGMTNGGKGYGPCKRCRVRYTANRAGVCTPCLEVR